jgi:hypothetical protein
VPTGLTDTIGSRGKLIDRLKKLHRRIAIELVAQ